MCAYKQTMRINYQLHFILFFSAKTYNAELTAKTLTERNDFNLIRNTRFCKDSDLLQLTPFLSKVPDYYLKKYQDNKYKHSILKISVQKHQDNTYQHSDINPK